MVEDVADPVVGPGDALVDIAYAAVNFTDALMVAGGYQVPAPPPFTLGSEFAGTVAAVGDDVDGVRPGDRVTGSTLVGAYAERIAVPASGLTPVPDHVGLDTAAAFGVAHATAYHALRSAADVQPGEHVAVLGAGGGVGLAAVEIAVHLGGHVVAAASSDAKLGVCRAQGAEATINYATEDLKTRLRELTDGGADVVIDPVGGPYSEPALRSCRFGARYVVLGFASGEIPRIPLNLVLLKGVTVTSFEFWNWGRYAADRLARDRAELRALLADGTLHPYVSAVYPLADVADALAAMSGRRVTGKILLDVRDARAGQAE